MMNDYNDWCLNKRNAYKNIIAALWLYTSLYQSSCCSSAVVYFAEYDDVTVHSTSDLQDIKCHYFIILSC